MLYLSLAPGTKPSASSITNDSTRTSSALLNLETTLFEFQVIDLGLGACCGGGGSISEVLGEAEFGEKVELGPGREEGFADGVGREEFVDFMQVDRNCFFKCIALEREIGLSSYGLARSIYLFKKKCTGCEKIGGGGEEKGVDF